MANSYRALTRTYRPQTFDDVVSQEHVSNTLKNAIAQDRLSHAYMFCGPRGVGKTTMARVLARTINQIDDQIDGESLSQTLNVVEIDAASNNKVEDVHHLREIVRVPPQSGKYKIFIIDEVHMLSKQAFNALLKTLEEPPPHAIFIFATTEPHKVLPTILSRVQRFDFKRISVDEIVSRLEVICAKEQITIDKESLHTIARKADGALRDALGLMDQAIAFCGLNIGYQKLTEALNVVGNDQLFEFTQSISDRDSNSGLLLVDRLLKEGVDIQEFLVSLTVHIRNLYVAKQSARMHMVEATDETKQRYINTAKLFSESDLMRMLHLVSEAQIKIKDVQQPRVHFEIVTLKLIHMGRSKEIGELLHGLDEVKKNGKKSSGELIERSGAVINGSGTGENGYEDANRGTESPLREKTGQSVKLTDLDAHESVTASGENKPAESKPEEHPHTEHDSAEEPRSREEHEMKAESGAKETGGDASMLVSDPVSSSDPISNNRNSEVDKGGAKGKIAEPNRDPEENSIFGKTSLGDPNRMRPTGNGSDIAPTKPIDTPEEVKVVLKGISDVEKIWTEYLILLEQRVSKTIFHQMEGVQLKNLKGTELILSVNNVFAVDIVEENKMALSEVLKEVMGIHLRLKCVVERKNSETEETLSPYERFKQIQKKDPQLGNIVELFGAEMEY